MLRLFCPFQTSSVGAGPFLFELNEWGPSFMPHPETLHSQVYSSDFSVLWVCRTWITLMRPLSCNLMHSPHSKIVRERGFNDVPIKFKCSESANSQKGFSVFVRRQTTKSFHMFQEPFIFHRHLSAARSVYCLWTLSEGLPYFCKDRVSVTETNNWSSSSAGEHEPYFAD